MPVVIKSPAEVAAMREAGRINAEVRAILRDAVRPGVSGVELDALAKREIARRDGVPTFVGYGPGGRPPYPGAICYSVNEVLVHGIPDERRLEEGDIVSIDLGVTYRGWVSDAAFTAPVGKVKPELVALLEATESAMWAGIRASTAEARLGDVSHAIESKANAYGIVRDYGGHGVGREMHEPPHILNFGKPGTGMKLKRGMVIALEPMFALGGPATEELDDRWSVRMVDRSYSAHFEETIAITDGEPEVLTLIA
ncbi:MAG: type I methionyl aminopeptidase [Dehalococcoidia bacterium]